MDRTVDRRGNGRGRLLEENAIERRRQAGRRDDLASGCGPCGLDRQDRTAAAGEVREAYEKVKASARVPAGKPTMRRNTTRTLRCCAISAPAGRVRGRLPRGQPLRRGEAQGDGPAQGGGTGIPLVVPQTTECRLVVDGQPAAGTHGQPPSTPCAETCSRSRSRPRRGSPAGRYTSVAATSRTTERTCPRTRSRSWTSTANGTG